MNNTLTILGVMFIALGMSMASKMNSLIETKPNVFTRTEIVAVLPKPLEPEDY